ncbi:hypothetical protein [Pseudonocardia sp.]|uniref:hypothetical protein n=1 Tax=Pseudonocardia sp. TaxID=60912 RepID=UPI003D0C990C
MNRRQLTQVGADAMRAPTVADADPRLLAGCGRIELGRIMAEHDAPAGSWCQRCRWPVGGVHRVCPSRALARSIRDRRPVPGWLLQLVDEVPGARAPAVPVSPQQRWAVEDALPGLFDAPPRQDPPPARPAQGGWSR